MYKIAAPLVHKRNILLVMFATAALFIAKTGHAQIELATGYAALEEGDERLRPAFAFHATINPQYFFRAYYWGRDYGPVQERGTLISFNYRKSVFSSQKLFAHFGAAAMNEQVKIDYKEDDKDDDFEQSPNLGGVVGVNYSLRDFAPFLVQVSWDSHLFLAGQGGLFMVTGRKQTMSLAAGVVF